MTTTQRLERSTQSTCATCPYFQDFDERDGRGWCQLFDQMARQHHARTGDCEQEIEAVESVQQEPVLETKAQLSEAGLAGDSVSCQLRSHIGGRATVSPKAAPQQLEPELEQTAETEFQQGRTHGRNDAEAKWHPIYTQPLTEYAKGYLAGYSIVLNPVAEQPEVRIPVEWSVFLDPCWELYQAWVGDHCIGHGATYEEAERIAQGYIAVDEMIRRQNQVVMTADAAGI